MIKPTYISANDLCDLFGITLRTLTDLQKREIVTRTSGNSLDLRENVRSYTSHLRQGAAARGASGPGLTAERERLVREQADREAMKNQLARKETVSVAEVEFTWSTILRDVRAALLALPGRIQQRIGHLTVAEVAQIDFEVRTALERLGDDAL